MVSKHRNETIRKRHRFEEKTGWEDINDPVRDRASHKVRALVASAAVSYTHLTLPTNREV